jgi:Methane oxygenase PmoA
VTGVAAEAIGSFRRVGLLTASWMLASAILAAASVKVERSAHQIEIIIDGKPFTTYFFDREVAKPYLMPLRTASGAILSRPFPVKNDVSHADSKASSFEPHQRPLYFGHGDFDGLDFWQEPAFDSYYSDHGRQSYGHLVLKSIEEAASEGDVAKIRARFSLKDPSNRVIAEETQSFAFRGDSQTRVIDCEFVLYATAGPLDIGDTKEGTFGIRLGPELSSPLGHMLNSNGAAGEKAIWGKPADWVDYEGIVSSKRVGIVVFDSPSSFHHPTTWHARAYGLLAANPFGLREFTQDPRKDGSWSIPEGKSATFRYRVLIYEGEFGVDQINAAYAKYASEK